MPPKLKADPKKVEAERLTALLQELLREEENKYCSECEAKQPRWASWNLGVFLCIRCAGLHRNLGVHISKVKSINLDSWTPEQVQSMRVMGNAKAKAVYESELPSMFRRPQSDQSLEAFIRAKYEAKRYILKDWSPPPVNVADCYSERITTGSPGLKSSTFENTSSHSKTSDERAEKLKPGPLTSVPISSYSSQSPKKNAQIPNLFDPQVNDSPAVLVNLFDSPVHSATPTSHQNDSFATQISDNLDDLFGPVVSASSNNSSFPAANGQVQPTAGSDNQQLNTLVGSTSAEANLFAYGGVSSASSVEPQLESVNFNDASNLSDNKKSTMDIMALFGSKIRPAPSQSMPAFNSLNSQQQHSSPVFSSNMMSNTQQPFQHQLPTTINPPALSGLDDVFAQFKM